MDTILFQQDWKVLSEDFMQAVQQCYSPHYVELLTEAIEYIQAHPEDLEPLIESFDCLSDSDLAVLMRALGILLEAFSILQHVYKTRSFANQEVRFQDIASDYPFELELFIAIQAHDSLSSVIKNYLNRWFKVLAQHRHTKETPLTETLRKQFISDCVAILKQEDFMQTLTLKEAFHSCLHQYSLHTLPGRLLLEDRFADPHLYHNVKVGFVIQSDLNTNDCLDILQELPARALEITWPIIAKQFPILLPHKQTVLAALAEGDLVLWKALPENSPSLASVTALYLCSPISLKLSSDSLTKLLENLVLRFFQKRLRRLLDECHSSNTPFPTITYEQILSIQEDLSVSDRHLLEILFHFDQSSKTVVTSLILSDLNDLYQLYAVDLIMHSIFSLNIECIISFENPGAITDSCKVLQGYWDFLKHNARPFPIKKVIIGNQQHTKDKSFWWTHTQLYHAQDDLLQWALSQKIDLHIIQSRGGSLARGSIPTRCLINSTLFRKDYTYLGLFIQPDAFRHRLNSKLTTEMTLFRYIKELLQERNHGEISTEVRHLQDSLAQHSLPEVIYYTQEQPDLIDYFYSVTPAANLSAQSQGLIKNHRIEEINSTVWFGCWSQSRLLLPFWLGFGSVLLQWDRADSFDKQKLLADRCIQALFLVTLISLYRVDLAILRAYEQELLSNHLCEVGEHLRQRYEKVITLAKKFVDFYEEDAYVKNFKDDMIYRSCYLTPLHCLQIQMLRRSRAQWPEKLFWKQFIRESMMFIGLGLQNSV